MEFNMDVFVKETVIDCINLATDLCSEMQADEPIVDRRKLPIEIRFKKSDKEIYIMERYTYRDWCMGRTYWMNGKLYHSGQVLNYTRW